MNRSTRTLSLVLALGAVVAGMAFTSTASARIPVEPGNGSPVTFKHPRQPAVKKIRRPEVDGHTHVRSLFAPDDQ